MIQSGGFPLAGSELDPIFQQGRIWIWFSRRVMKSEYSDSFLLNYQLLASENFFLNQSRGWKEYSGFITGTRVADPGGLIRIRSRPSRKSRIRIGPLRKNRIRIQALKDLDPDTDATY